MEVKLKYFRNLDGLRGIAAISVLIFHFFLDNKLTNDLENIELIRKITEVLQHGVTLFFVLSGFVITRILLNTKNNNNYFSRFYIRRALRIFPLYYLYLICHFYIFPTLVGEGPDLNFEKQLSIYLYLQNMGWLTGWSITGPGHYWSLAVEEHFYIIWPLILYLVPDKGIKATIIILIIISIPIKMLLVHNSIDINYNTFSRYDSIMIGCLIAQYEKESNYSLLKYNSNKIIIYLIAILAVGFFIYFFQNNIFFIKSVTKHLILGIFFGMTIYYFITSCENMFTNKILNTKIAQYLGKISYGIYVWHIMAINGVALLNINNYIFNLISVISITLLLAHVSYYYYEIKFIKQKLN
jgi:peptidoglycan/LPS O-acetylase OafA/YrhL